MIEMVMANALGRRKELMQKVAILSQFKAANLFNEDIQRKAVGDGIDEIRAKFPKMTASQVTEEFDWHARQLRLIDAAIQQQNWATTVLVPESVDQDYKPSKA